MEVTAEDSMLLMLSSPVTQFTKLGSNFLDVCNNVICSASIFLSNEKNIKFNLLFQDLPHLFLRPLEIKEGQKLPARSAQC